MSAQQWVVTHGGSFLSRLDLHIPRRGRNAGHLLHSYEWTEDPDMALHFDKATAETFAGIATNLGGSVHGVAPHAATPKTTRRKS